MSSLKNNNHLSRSAALKFVLLFGLISLLADATYEGARSINGQFLAVLGASGALVGFVSGFGELIGYGIRFLSGYLSDRTRQYWLVTIGGYIINLLAVPILALAGSWQLAAVLMVTERIGKGIRTAVTRHIPHRPRLGIRPPRGLGPDRRRRRSSHNNPGALPERLLQDRILHPAHSGAAGSGSAGHSQVSLPRPPQPRSGEAGAQVAGYSGSTC